MEEKEDKNIVFIGSKSLMTYVTSAIIQLTTKNRDEVIIKARGKFITKAVDTAEITKNNLSENQKIEIKNIKTNSEEFENKEGRKIKVSTIEITIKKYI